MSQYTAADLISDFVAEFLYPNVFLVTGGACSFMVDAIGRNPRTKFTCFQHEQAAAMAADAIWRTKGVIGVTMATSGPGATNLITGIACSWFDSIPSFHITGQVNKSESKAAIGAKVRQAGFQETDIVSMVSSITKLARRIEDVEDLSESLHDAYFASLTGRMGPVLLDIAMNVQKEKFNVKERDILFQKIRNGLSEIGSPKFIDLYSMIKDAKRPLIVIGGGAALGGTAGQIEEKCKEDGIPYATSWAAISAISGDEDLYMGSIGVYGSRHANWAIQAADVIVFFGSRLDNRQRTANPKGFAPFALKFVIDIDDQELAKFHNDSSYKTLQFDLRDFHFTQQGNKSQHNWVDWKNLLGRMRKMTSNGFGAASPSGGLNAYEAIIELQKKMPSNSIVTSDCGANLCWVYQAWSPGPQMLFTAGGNSPMGYSLPAAIGVQLSNRETPVFCFIGDGGLQMNIQELQTIRYHNLPIQIIVQNNSGYGIIKQFQDAYFEGRHFATGEGYSVPSFEKIVNAYELEYTKCTSIQEIRNLHFDLKKPLIVDLVLPPDSLITPKVEMDRFIHDQFPYGNNEAIKIFPKPYPDRVSQLKI